MSQTQAPETLRPNDTDHALAAIAACPFVLYSSDQLRTAWKRLEGLHAPTSDAFGAASRYLLSVERQQAQQGFAANQKQTPSTTKLSQAQELAQQRERKKEGQQFQKQFEEILPILLEDVGANVRAKQFPSPFNPGDPESVHLAARLQLMFQSVSGDRDPKTAEALAKKIEMENTEASFETAVAVAEWVATRGATHKAPFELLTLME